MLPVGLILAQVVTLSVGDRTEGRYVALFDRHFEASTRPLAGAKVDWKHLTLTLRYAPTLTVVPVESKDRDLFVFNNAYLAASYSWSHTRFELSQTSSFGAQNFYVLSLTDPRFNTAAPPVTPPAAAPVAPPGGTTGGTPGANMGTGTMNGTPSTTTPGVALPYANRAIHYGSSTTSAAIRSETSPSTTLRGELSYLIAGATQPEDAVLYPLVKGPLATGSAQFRISRRDAVASTLSMQYVSSSIGTSAWITNYAQSWIHRLDHHTATQLGVGVSGTRSPAANGFIAYSIYPTFTAGIIHTSIVERGKLTTSVTVSSAPAIDLITTAVDPRLGTLAQVGWARDRFSASLSADATISLAAKSELGALSLIGAGAGVAYRLSTGVSLDSGARVAYQKYQGQVVIPFSQTIYLAVNFLLDQRL
jgi:hypothetical protein